MNDSLLQSALRQHQAGNLAEAARLYAAVLSANPRHFQALYLLGFVRSQEGRFEDAVRLIGDAVRINRNSPDAFYNLGCALQNLQRHEEALTAFEQAVTLKSDYDEAHINRGVALLALRRHHEALASLDRALALKPRDAEALGNRAATLFELKRFEEAAAGYAALVAVAPDFPYAEGNLILARAWCCDWRSYATDMARLTASIRAGKPAISAHGATLVSSDAPDQLLAARRWVSDRCPPSPTPVWRGEPYRHEKIRVAYVSADFHAHATAFLIAGVLEQHDRTRFEVTGISFGPDDGSEMRGRIVHGFERFIDVGRRSDKEVAALLRQMEIDIAVDLKGHTQGARSGIFALRPAPLQVNYLGHPGTMGADYIDYILADETVIPHGRERSYSEKVVRLPGSYQANDSARRIADRSPSRAEMGLGGARFVFCSFNNTYKITPEMFTVWMRLLGAVEGSVLWLFEDNSAAVRNLKREADARGIDPVRLVFAPRADVAAHLARHRLADLFLDTLPCCAHTTASDALWAGLPVLTCAGATFAGRVAASLLQAIGMPELIADSLAAYETVALTLAREPATLAAMKATLDRNRGIYPLFDTVRTTRDLETAYRTMHARAQRGLPPESFSVESVP